MRCLILYKESIFSAQEIIKFVQYVGSHRVECHSEFLTAEKALEDLESLQNTIDDSIVSDTYI